MTPDTFPAALVEALATVITDAVAECDNGPGLYPHEARQIATAALSALPADAQAVARGEAVAVPREPTPEMIEDAAEELPTWAGDMPDDEAVIGIYDALLAASPYAQEPHGASVHPTTKETDK